MTRVHIYCEGPTEEAFVNRVLYYHFIKLGVYVNPIIFQTKRTDTKKFTGGGLSFDRMKREINNISLCDKDSFITTMIDYYALPNTFPGRENPVGRDIYEKAKHIEQAIGNEIGLRNFIPNIIIHEFEALLFSDPSAFDKHFGSSIRMNRIQEIMNLYKSPEHVNDSFETAPSKRIEKAYGHYNKVADGTAIASQIGIDNIISQCLHFAEWIRKIESINGY